MNHSKNIFVAVFALLILSAGLAEAQSTADMEGNVVDASHHPVVSAFVIVTGRDTSLMRAATTDDKGDFEFAGLPVGRYELQVKADGFLPFRDREVWVNIGQVARLNIVLSTGDVSSGTHGQGGTLLVETSNTQL